MKILKEEAETQAKQDFIKARKDIELTKWKERDAKEKRLGEKHAGAVRWQKECLERKRKAEIASGARNSAGKKVMATVNNTVCGSSSLLVQTHQL